MRAPISGLDLPVIYSGWFLPISHVIYDRDGPCHTYVTPEGLLLPVSKRGYSGTSYRLSVLGDIRRKTGGILVMRAKSKNARHKYAQVSDGHVRVPWTNPLYHRIGELPFRYILHYDHHEWTERAFRELAVHYFGEPRDRRYYDYIVGTQEVYDQYAACFDRVP